MGDVGMGGAYGVHFADGNQLYNIFVKPFTDVVGVAAGKTKEMSERAQTLLKVAFEATATSLVPILRDSYGEVFEKEKEQIDKIRSEYSDVYQATWDAFKENDVLVAAFMYRPDLFLTQQFAEKAPKAAAKLISVLSGGKLDNLLQKLLKGDGHHNKHAGGRQGGGMPFEGVIREDGEHHGDNPLGRLLGNKKVKAVLANSPKVKQMTQVGQKLAHHTLTQVYDQAKTVLTAKSLNDVQHALKKKLPGTDKLSQVPQQERQKAEQDMLKGIHAGMKAFYVKQLEAQVKATVDAGVPKDHPYVKDYVSVIGKIKAL